MKIVIDGNIGAGKTTQLGLLESKGWYVHREEIDKWPLKEFYEDQGRWGFLLQMRILQTLEQNPTDRHIIHERSCMSSRFVFWPLISEKVLPMEKDCYEYYFKKMAWVPDIYIYLSKKPEIAYEHIQKRKQTGDETITLEYLQELDEKYKQLIVQSSGIHVIDANRSESEIHEEICKILVENELFVRDSFR